MAKKSPRERAGYPKKKLADLTDQDLKDILDMNETTTCDILACICSEFLRRVANRGSLVCFTPSALSIDEDDE